jgi:hypothetical protein
VLEQADDAVDCALAVRAMENRVDKRFKAIVDRADVRGQTEYE